MIKFLACDIWRLSFWKLKLCMNFEERAAMCLVQQLLRKCSQARDKWIGSNYNLDETLFVQSLEVLRSQCSKSIANHSSPAVILEA